MASVTKPRRESAQTPALPPFPGGGQPVWEIAYLFPAQGAWTVNDYEILEGACEGAARVELSNGRLDVIPMPTELHELILIFFLEQLKIFTQSHAPGIVLASGVKLRLKTGRYRKADVVYMKAENAHRRHNEYWDGADLVMEVVSPDPKDRKRDWVTKPREYALAGISEYWIIDSEKQVIRVLSLDGKAYRVHGDFALGTQATSVLLPGFAVSVDAALAPPGSER